MKKATVIFFLSLIVVLVSCSSTNSPQLNKTNKSSFEGFSILGEWQIKDVVFVGNIHEKKPYKEPAFYSLLGVGWNQTKGKSFVFKTNNHWYSTAFEEDLNQKDFIYDFADSLILTVKGKNLDFRFPLVIKDTTSNTMVWDIGHDVELIFERK